MDKITGNVYQTRDYSKFMRLEGNREVVSKRVVKITKSIQQNGYILNPIVVNEKMQVIDGQGRLEALKGLKMPVDYVIAEGAGLNECVALNSSTTQWRLEDFITSYCEQGNKNYIRLKKLLEEFPKMNLSAKCAIISGCSDGHTEAIKQGKAIVTEEIEKEARNNLIFANRFAEDFKRIKGVPKFWYYGIVFARKCGASEVRLKHVIEKSTLNPAPTIRTALDEISDLYNKNYKDKIWLYVEYQNSMTDKYGWYQNKWGKRNERSTEL